MQRYERQKSVLMYQKSTILTMNDTIYLKDINKPKNGKKTAKKRYFCLWVVYAHAHTLTYNVTSQDAKPRLSYCLTDFLTIGKRATPER